eukprot:6548120-Prymnesium_polylepis.1
MLGECAECAARLAAACAARAVCCMGETGRGTHGGGERKAKGEDQGSGGCQSHVMGPLTGTTIAQGIKACRP